MRRRTALGPTSTPGPAPRHLTHPVLSDYVDPGEHLDDPAANAGQRLAAARDAWDLEHPQPSKAGEPVALAHRPQPTSTPQRFHFARGHLTIAENRVAALRDQCGPVSKVG